MNKVLMVYECDVWLSRHDRKLVAVCTDWEDVRQVLLEYRDCNPDQVAEVMMNGQSQCGDSRLENNFIVEEVEVNKLLVD
jgi:hypothetical protein